jgi:hypothetical protein
MYEACAHSNGRLARFDERSAAATQRLLPSGWHRSKHLRCLRDSRIVRLVRMRPTDAGLMNENAAWVSGILEAIKALRLAYRDKSFADAETRIRELLALLRASDTRLALDAELQTRRIWPRALDDPELVRQEAALGNVFGYSSRQVEDYVRRAKKALAAGGDIPDISTSLKLEELLGQLHDLAMHHPADGGWWERRKRERTARRAADGRLFAVGAVIANTAQRSLFDLSYSLAVLMLAEADT